IGAHLLAAAPDAVDTWAVDWLVRHAAPLADRVPELAVELLPIATGRVEPDDARLGPLLHRLAQALTPLNRDAAAESAGRRAIALNRDPPEAGRLAFDLADNLYAADRGGDCVAATDEALADGRTTPLWRARLLALRARALVGVGDAEGAERIARQ